MADADKAERLAAELKKQGFAAYTEPAGKVVRVRVGPVAGRSAADKAAVQLKVLGFSTVITALVDGLINPLIAMIFGKPNMDGLLAFTFNGATVSFGAILSAVLNFLIVAAAVYFCILVPINKLRDMSEALIAKAKGEEDAKVKEEQEKKLSSEEETVLLLREIRDQLAKQGGDNTSDMPSGVR